MSDYYYVTKEKAAPFKERIIDVIGMVYDDLIRKYTDFDFDYKFSGPSANNMISYDNANNDIGIEFDVDIIFDRLYNADLIIQIFKDAFSKYYWSYNYRVNEDINEIDITFNNGEYTCSLHFVVESIRKAKGLFKYIVYDEDSQNYIWISSSNKYKNISEEIEWLKEKKLWMQLRDYFLYRRDHCEEGINSKDMFFICVHDMAVKNGIYKKTKTSESNTAENQKIKKKSHNFVYVSNRQAKPAKDIIDEILEYIDNDLKGVFSFQPKYVGSSSRKMITYDTKGNVGYDFDVDIILDDSAKSIKPKKIRAAFRNALNKYTGRYGFSFAGDSTSVTTIKVIDQKNSKVVYSCDFAIVRKDKKGHKQFIRFNKKQNTYTWEYRGSDFDDISEKIEWIKSKKLYNNLRDCYLNLKNINYCDDKHSRSIFAEAVNNICHENEYKKRK